VVAKAAVVAAAAVAIVAAAVAAATEARGDARRREEQNYSSAVELNRAARGPLNVRVSLNYSIDVLLIKVHARGGTRTPRP
jgi:hypothetical protein